MWRGVRVEPKCAFLGVTSKDKTRRKIKKCWKTQCLTDINCPNFSINSLGIQVKSVEQQKLGHLFVIISAHLHVHNQQR